MTKLLYEFTTTPSKAAIDKIAETLLSVELTCIFNIPDDEDDECVALYIESEQTLTPNEILHIGVLIGTASSIAIGKHLFGRG